MDCGPPNSANPPKTSWHLDKTFNISHILATISIAGSFFAYANSMDKRIVVLEEKLQAQAYLIHNNNAEMQRQILQTRKDTQELFSDVKTEMRLLRGEILQVVSGNGERKK